MPDTGDLAETALRRQFSFMHGTDPGQGTTVGGSVQIKHRRVRADRGELTQAGRQRVAVIAEGGTATARPVNGFEYPGDVFASFVTGRPVTLELRNQPVERTLRTRQLVEEEVPAHT